MDRTEYFEKHISNETSDFKRGYMQAEKDLGWQSERTFELMALMDENEKLTKKVAELEEALSFVCNDINGLRTELAEKYGIETRE